MPCIGCGLRTFSKRCTRAESAASRNSTCGATPRAPSEEIADFRSVENARDRTSTIAAMPASDARSARSSIVGSSAGGRLSTTNQPRSSSDLAAVDRPAPDMPVMMTMSGAPRPGAFSALLSVIALRSPRIVRALLLTTVSLDARLPQRDRHRLGQLRPDPGTAAAISCGDADEIAFTEPNAFSSAARRDGPSPGHAVERGRDRRLARAWRGGR